MKLFSTILFAMFLGNMAFADPPQLKLMNPTEREYDLFFRPENSTSFLRPPLRLSSGGSANLVLATQGKYRTVLRSWPSSRQYVDSNIGWIDFRRAYLDNPAISFKFVPYSATETRTRMLNVQRYVSETRTGADGVQYTVRVPVMSTVEQTYTVEVPAVKVVISSPGKEDADASKYISDRP